MSEPEKVFVHSPYVPYDPGVALYDTEGWNGGGDAEAWEYTGWRDEVMSWKESCYIHGHLNPSPTYVLRGPDALRFLTDFCVNSFATFPVGSSKHAIMCNDEGNIMVHGMLLRLGDEEFISYWLSPWLPYLLMKHGEGYDVQGEDLTGQVFLFQIAGPRSLEVLEAATGDNLHDIRFLRHRPSTVDGRDVNVIRIGMAGTLAYELHGALEDALPVYRKVLEAGDAEHHHTLYADHELNADGDIIGQSSGRAQSWYYREMLSLATLDTAYVALGTEVFVLWGEPGTRQKKIRAVVSRFPYLNENRNEDVDVDTIPAGAVSAARRAP